jgi:hypothetical protein
MVKQSRANTERSWRQSVDIPNYQPAQYEFSVDEFKEMCRVKYFISQINKDSTTSNIKRDSLCGWEFMKSD